jgi:glutamyl-tRNA reductase
MKLALAGINHTTAPIEVRERFAFSPEGLAEALRLLHHEPGFQEGLILSTCNRVEVAAALEDDLDTRAALSSFLASSHQLEPEAIRPYVYVFEEAEAIRHLFRVAASLDSMVVGEPQLLGQLKQAYYLARDQGVAGRHLDAVLTRAFSVAKRVRTETEIGRSPVSVSYAAVELAREIFGSLQRRRVMVIGAGEMSEAAVRHLQSAGAAEILIANRTQSRADELADLVGAAVVPYIAIYKRLAEVDIVITSSSAPHYVLTKAHVRNALDARRNQPMFLVDIAVPRNIEPTVNDLEHAFLYDIDDLQRIVERNLNARREVAEDAERIVSQEVERLVARLRQRDITPTIVSFQEQLEAVRREVLARYRPKLGSLTAEQEQTIDALTRGIINKIAHGPISEMRREAAEHAGEAAGEVVSFVRRMFRLGERDQ